jgi:hypothetical protein
VTANLDALGAKLAAHPVPPVPEMPPGFPDVDRNLFDSILGQITRDRAMWDVLPNMIKELQAESTDARKALTLLAQYAIAETRSGVFQTVTCEADWPTDLNTYYDQMRLFREKYPYGQGAMAAAPTECTFRSFTPPERPVNLQRKGYPTGLVIQAEYDGNTQYEGGPAMASTLNDNLVSVSDEGGHGMYGRNACATQRINDYLLNGILPGSRSVCAGEPRPNVPPDPAAAAPQAKSAQSLESQVRTLIAKDTRLF